MIRNNSISRPFRAQLLTYALAGLVVLIAMTALASALNAQTLPSTIPSVGQILADAKAAAGGSNLDSIRTYDIKSTIATGGLTGTQEEWDDLTGGRYSVRYTLGPTSGGQGYDGSRPWNLDQSGIVTYAADADSVQSAVSDVYSVTMSFWYANRLPGSVSYLRHATENGRDFDVLQVSPKGGYTFELWLDSKTHLIDRIVEPLAEQTQTTYYSDYRMVDGTEQAFTQRETNGKPKYDTVTKIESISLNSAVPPGQFDAPKAQGPQFDIQGGGSSVTVPFEYKGDEIYLPIKINDRSYSAILDTGGAYVMTPDVAKQLGIKPQGANEATGGGEGSVDSGFAKVDTVQIGGLTVHQPTFYVIPIPMIDTNPLIGYEILNQFVIKVDYDHHTITFTEPSHYQYSGSGIVLPFRLNHTMPEVDGTIDGIPGVFTIDAGSSQSLEVAAPFVRKNDLFAKYHPKFTVVSGYGVGGADHAGITRVKTLTLGSATVHDLVTSLLTDKAGSGANKIVAANVGEGVLHQFNVTYDYTRQRIILEPNSSYAAKDIYNRVGAVLDSNKEQAVVADIVPNSPAADAGIKVGDTLLRLNGKAISRGALREVFRGPVGSRVVLQVKSGHTVRSVTLVLRDLV